MPSEYDISLNIRNNRNYAQTFNGMGGSVNPLDTSNATTEYRYNITTFNFSDENSITIYYKAVGTTNFSSFTADLTSQTPEGLVFALNGLGIGFFNTYVELGQTYLGTYNENYIFGSLDVYNSSIPTTTTTSTSTTTTTIFVPTTTTTSTTSTTTSLAPTTSTTSTTTSLAPTTTSTTTTTTSLAPTTTSTTTTTTSLAPTTTTTTSTTTSTTTEAATTTSTTTSTTTEAATTTSTTTSTTTEAATTTTTSTSTTTTTLEPTTTTTSTTTTTTTIAFSGSVGYSGNDATVCFTPVATFTMTGNAGSFCASTIFTSASWGAVASGAYFIANGGNILPVNHILGENTATTSGACTACPITTTTTTTSTTSTTTTLPPTTTTTSTTTTTTTLAFSGSVGYSGNDATVCFTPVASFTMTGNAGSFCASTIFTSASWGAVASGAYFIANGGNILPVNHILGENTATTSGTCTACPITTTTTTTSTTSTTTTLPPTTTTTSTTTTTTTLAFSGSVGYSGNDATVCFTPVASFTMTGNAGSFCASTIFTSASWGAVASGAYFIANGGNILPVNHILGENTATTSGTCTACPITTTTTTTSTTSTSTTSTTTTLPGIAFGVSVTTKYGTEFLACGGTVTGTRYQPPAFGNVPTDGAQLYTDSTLQTTWTPAEGAGLYLFQFGGSTKWAVFVGVTGLVGAVSACSGVTTTTTTTSTTTTTTTAAPVAYTIDNGANGSAYGACTGSVPTSVVYAEPGNTVPIVGLILYTNQNLTTPFVGSAGWRKLVSPSSVAYAAEVNSSGEITNYVTCTSQTTTTTSTTTSTTTLPGIAFGVSINTKYGTEFLACGGTVTGVRYQNPGFGNTPTTEAQLYTDSTLQTTWTPSAGAGLYLFQFGGSTKWAVFVDATGIVGAVSACSGVTTTTTSTTSTTSTFTTSTTSTTTTAAPVTYTIDNAATGSPFEACTGSTTTSFVYAAPGNTSPIVGLILYTNQNLTSPFVGSAGWRKLVQGATSYAAVVNTIGEITDYATCASQTTTTTTQAPTTSTTSTTTTSIGATIDIATNNSLDIEISISGIEVNGVAVTNVTGVDPNTPGNGGSCQTTEIGTYTIVIPYSVTSGGQSISLVDSDSTPQCQGTGSGSGFLTFTGVVINTSQPPTITANEGACP